MQIYRCTILCPMIEIGNLSAFVCVPYTMGVLPMKRAKCCTQCVNWRNAILYLLLTLILTKLIGRMERRLRASEH